MRTRVADDLWNRDVRTRYPELVRPLWALLGLATLVLPAFGACGINKKGAYDPGQDGGGGDAAVDADGSAGVGGGSCFPGSKVCPDASGQLTCPKLENPSIGCLAETFCTPCISPHAKAACSQGHCAIDVCDADWEDCNDNPVDGCEANLKNDPSHCGVCGTDCLKLHGPGWVCKAGQCVVNLCHSPTTLDCNNDQKDGCEVDTATDPKNCLFCGNECKLPHAESECAEQACAVTSCETGWRDCDKNPANGCEVDTAADKAHCGVCGHVCDETNASAYCALGVCEVVCAPGFGDCDGNAENGCETDFNKDGLNCGSCGKKCSPANVGKPACDNGSCSYEACAPGFGDCDANRANGCETNIYTEKDHCNGCNNVCPPVSGGTSVCNNGVCGGACTGAVELCGKSCANLQTDVENCGTCGDACNAGPPNSMTSCNDGSCGFDCNAGFDACGTGGCIDLMSDPANCGKCGNGCTGPANTTSSCNAGSCTWSCPAGQVKCGSGGSAFCTDLTSDAKNCGSCGYACPTPSNGSASCKQSACDFGCVSPSVKCGGLCVDMQSDAANCGGCGVVCGNGKVCIAGSCACPTTEPIVCNGDCTDTATDPRNCNVCGKVCNLGAKCVQGNCLCQTPTPDLCGTTCTDKMKDLKNCGICGYSCPPGLNNCTNGVCKP